MCKLSLVFVQGSKEEGFCSIVDFLSDPLSTSAMAHHAIILICSPVDTIMQYIHTLRTIEDRNS